MKKEFSNFLQVFCQFSYFEILNVLNLIGLDFLYDYFNDYLIIYATDCSYQSSQNNFK